MVSTLGTKQQQLLDDFVVRIRAAAGDNLGSIVLYGSAVSDDFQAGISDLNLLVLLHRLDAAALAALKDTLRWWSDRGQPAPLLFTLDELRRAADVFAIELLDIRARHRTLHGPDEITSLRVPMDLHRVQVERELRTSIVRVRQRFLAAPDDKAVLDLMTQSASTFHTLFRHTLIALGEPAPESRREVVEALEGVLKVDVAPLRTLLDVREGRVAAGSIKIRETFAQYLQALSAAADEVDRRLPGPAASNPS